MITLIEFVVAGFAVMAVTGLACFHTQLIATMKTTNEDVKINLEIVHVYFSQIKGTYRTSRNPFFQHNWCKNFCIVLCGPFPPRYNVII